MNAHATFGILETVVPAKGGKAGEHVFGVRESAGPFQREVWIETIVRSAGMLMVLGALAPWLLSLEGTMHSKVMFSLLAVATGLFLFAFATRGFRRELEVNFAEQMIRLRSLNSYGRSRISKDFHLVEVQSMFVRRPSTPGELAALHLRVRGVPTSLCALRGETPEIEGLHRRLCQDLRRLTENARAEVYREKASARGRRVARVHPTEA
ncbi:hypothetical protein [Roseovarius salinarum]|uniref:hypothetical protein n=1 Tax=Roseovarius salinarum TaxID=1981892 RepID=UPI000C346B07|nr:hypothetical protein [Roseovarius salinarum]